VKVRRDGNFVVNASRQLEFDFRDGAGVDSTSQAGQTSPFKTQRHGDRKGKKTETRFTPRDRDQKNLIG
jgi:hypothetical protein